MTLLISNENVQDALDSQQLRVGAIIDRIEQGYRDLASDQATYAPRRVVSVPLDEAHQHAGFKKEAFSFGSVEGAMPSTGYFAVRLKLDMTYQLDDPNTGATTHEKYCIEPGRYCGLILLVDTRTAEPLALMNDGIVQHLRVAATNILAAKYMARTNARVLGIYGSGGMAHSHAHMMNHVRELTEIRVYSPTRAHREAFAAQIQAELKLPVHAIDHPEQLPEGCDMITACTDASGAVILPAAIQSGLFLSSVTAREVAAEVKEKIDAIVLHQANESNTVLTYATDAGRVSPAGRIEPLVETSNPAFAAGPRVRGTLAELVSGHISGREAETEVNYFYNNLGSGLQFAAIAGEVYRTLKGTPGLREIPTDWLTQTIRD